MLDDAVRFGESSPESKRDYVERADYIDKQHSWTLFDELTLRETYNKIMHAEGIDPHYTDGVSRHRDDDRNDIARWQQMHDSPNSEIDATDKVEWKHLTGVVRISGRHHGKKWHYHLEIPRFIEAICEFLELPAVMIEVSVSSIP